MGIPNSFNDTPISTPQEDRFGIDPFARALAKSFQKLASPVGATIALNGPWGSGKSSAVNLIRHHLDALQDNGELTVVDFKCWWFHGEEALTLAFLQALNGAFEKGLKEKAKELLPKIGKKLMQAGPVIGPAINWATGGLGGTVASGAFDFVKSFFGEGDSVEKVFHQLSEALSQQKGRFMVLIDDIDRLTPDEALLIFRLIKSVGRLPNVMYLLVFDRELAEKAVKERYPSEGPHFLEKIIQASFELPLPSRDDLNKEFLKEIDALCGVPRAQDEALRFMNILYDIVSPDLNTPRDLVRLVNSIAISWPPVAQEVDVADFVALEVIRVFELRLYNAIRANKDRVCGVAAGHGRQQDRESAIKFLLETVDQRRQDWARTTLCRLFPRFENVGYSEEWLYRWDAARLLCVEKHFDTYFRMAVGDETLSRATLDEFVERCGDKRYVKTTLRKVVKSIGKNGKSKAPVLLDDVNTRANRIDKAKFPALISGLFEVADEIDLEADQESAFSIGNAQLRIHWLIRKLTFERCTLNERSAVFVTACRKAQLGWLLAFTSSAIRDYHPRDGQPPTPPERCLIAQDALDNLRGHALAAIKEAAARGALLMHPQLGYLLYEWRNLADGKSVQIWTNEQLVDDVAVARLAKAFTGESWSQNLGRSGIGDRVATPHIQASVDGLPSILNVIAFRKRLEEIKAKGTLASPYRDYVNIFLDAWAKQDRKRRSAPQEQLAGENHDS